MTFDQLYPNQAEDLLQIDVQRGGSNLVKLSPPHPCWNCGNMTSWIDINFEANLCSEECFDKKWKEYEIAFKAFKES